MKYILLASFALAAFSQPTKNYKVELPAQDWQTILIIIDNSATPGEVRKPLLQNIQRQIMAQDSTVTKKPK